METKLYLNAIKTLNATHQDLIVRMSRGDTMMSHLIIFDRILSECLRMDIIERHRLYIDTENKLHTHEMYGPNDLVDFMEFNAWVLTYEQIMREEGLVGNTGTGEDDADRESVFIDPFVTPFVRKKGSSVSKVDPAENDKDTEEDGADEEESDEEDRTDEDSEEEPEGASGGADPSDSSETEEEAVQEESDGESDEKTADDSEDAESTEDDEDTDDDEAIHEEGIPPKGFHSFAFNMGAQEPVEEEAVQDYDESSPIDPYDPNVCKCPVCDELFLPIKGRCRYTVDGDPICVPCSDKLAKEELEEEKEVAVVDDDYGFDPIIIPVTHTDEEQPASEKTGEPETVQEESVFAFFFNNLPESYNDDSAKDSESDADMEPLDDSDGVEIPAFVAETKIVNDKGLREGDEE